jgi:hypothetical protein
MMARYGYLGWSGALRRCGRGAGTRPTATVLPVALRLAPARGRGAGRRPCAFKTSSCKPEAESISLLVAAAAAAAAT